MQLSEVLQHHELDGGPFYWEAGTVGVLLLHGLTATTAEVRPLAKYLFERGFTVAGPLLPGHGTTPGELNRQKWENWASSAEDAYQGLFLHCQSVIVAGESMGGILGLYLASKHAEIPGIILYAPAFRIPGIERARFIAPFVPFVRKRPGDGSMPWQGYYVNPTSAVAQLYRLQREVRRRLMRISQPALIFQGRLDQTVDLRGAQELFDQLGSRNKELKWLDQSGHVILLDKEFDRAAEMTLTFIKSVIED